MKHHPKSAALLFAALLLLALAAWSYGQQPVASFYYDESGHVIRQEQDTNGDGKMDRWIYYNLQGQTERLEQDVNFDGKVNSKDKSIVTKNQGHTLPPP